MLAATVFQNWTASAYCGQGKTLPLQASNSAVRRDRDVCVEFCSITKLVFSFRDENLVARQHLESRLPALAAGHDPTAQNRTLTRSSR